MVFEVTEPPAATSFGSLIAIIAAIAAVIYYLYRSVLSGSSIASLHPPNCHPSASELPSYTTSYSCRTSYACTRLPSPVELARARVPGLVCLLQVSTVSVSATQQPWNQRSTTPPIPWQFVENTEGNVLVFITDS